MYSDYENEFEKQLFFAINICRHDPPSFITQVKRVAAYHPLCKGKDTKDLCEYLRRCERLTAVSFDENAVKAARQNNADTVAKEEEVPTRGGNSDAYNAIAENDKQYICEEYTMCQYDGDQAKEFIALELILDWNREGEAGKKSPVLNAETSKVGISNKGHKKTKNLIQILYLLRKPNTLD